MIHFLNDFYLEFIHSTNGNIFFFMFCLENLLLSSPIVPPYTTSGDCEASYESCTDARSGHRYGSRPSLAAEYATCVNLLNMCCCWKASLMIFTTCLKSLVLLKELLRHCSRCQTLYILHYCTDSMKPKNLVTHCFTVSLFKCFTVL